MILPNLSSIESASGEDLSGIEPTSGKDSSGIEPASEIDESGQGESGEDVSGRESSFRGGMLCRVYILLISFD